MMNEIFARWHQVPLDPDYGSCEETRAKLFIYPNDISQEEVTNILGIEPSRAHNLGKRILDPLGRTGTAPRTVWGLSSEGHVHSKDLRDHLNWLLDRIEPCKDALDRLRTEHEGVMRIGCVWWSAAGHGGPTLWPEQMKRLADLEIECQFDIYFFGDDEDSWNSSSD
jgi:hypothetical protein